MLLCAELLHRSIAQHECDNQMYDCRYTTVFKQNSNLSYATTNSCSQFYNG